MGKNAIKIPGIEKLFLEISLGLGFISTSPVNNSIDNRKLENGHKCTPTKILVNSFMTEEVIIKEPVQWTGFYMITAPVMKVKIRIYRTKCLAVLQYLYLSDKNALTKMRNISMMFEIGKFSLFKTAYDIVILFIRLFKFDL